MMNRLGLVRGSLQKGSPVKRLLLFATILFSGAAFAQAIPSLDDPPAAAQQAAGTLAPGTMAPQVATTTAPSTVTIPAGTRVLMVLKSPLHTTSGTAGSGLYLETLYPVIQENRVVIPAHTSVQGVVEAGERPGHVKRTAEFQFRFTALIFPNNFVAPIEGVLQSIPGARNIRAHDKDKDGTLETVDQAEKVVTPALIGAVSGATIGSNHNFGIGKFTGAGLGAALGLGSVLLKRGDAINLAPGTQIEMVLQAPLSLEQAQVAENARNTLPASSFPELKDPAATDERSDHKRKVLNGRRAPGLLGLLQPPK